MNLDNMTIEEMVELISYRHIAEDSELLEELMERVELEVDRLRKRLANANTALQRVDMVIRLRGDQDIKEWWDEQQYV